MDEQGYVLVRGVLPVEETDRLLQEMLSVVSAAGWLLPGHDPLARMADGSKACGDSDPEFKSTYQRIFSLESFHRFAHHPLLQRVMRQLAGERLLVHPKPIGRLIFPNCERLVVHAHQDHQSVAGDAESFTAWIPLHDCPEELGPLQILEGSHRFGLQVSDAQTGFLSSETALGKEWVGGDLKAGDVLIFHSLTVHAATPNVSNQLRVSIDCRFQDYGRALNPALLVFPGGNSNGRTWESTYANWESDELKYYWTRLPLRLQPSKAELAELARTDNSSAMRARYERVLRQIEVQMPD